MNGVSTFSFFYFGVSALFVFNQGSKLFLFFYFCVSTVFLFNQVCNFFFLFQCFNFIFVQSNVSTLNFCLIKCI